MLPQPMKTHRLSTAPSRVRQVLGLASVGFLIAFHAILLWERLADSTLFEPVPAIRWLATVALIALLFRLHRRGVSLLQGRGALVLWLLVLLLHVSFWGPLADPTISCEGWGGPGLLLALPALTIILGGVSPSLRRILARLLSDPDSGGLRAVGWLPQGQTFAKTTGFLPALACRPPPAH